MVKNRLQNVLNIAEAAENKAARVFVEARTRWRSDKSKLLELQDFRSDYGHSDNQPQTVSQFQSNRIFLAQLSQAIDQQELKVVEMLTALESEEKLWLATRIKRKSIARLIEKRAVQKSYEESRQEQKEQDEVSQRSDFSS